MPEVGQAIRHAGERASGTLLVYYSGHGLPDEGTRSAGVARRGGGPPPEHRALDGRVRGWLGPRAAGFSGHAHPDRACAGVAGPPGVRCTIPRPRQGRGARVPGSRPAAFPLPGAGPTYWKGSNIPRSLQRCIRVVGSSWKVKPCSAPHTHRFLRAVKHSGARYPGDHALSNYAKDNCPSGFVMWPQRTSWQIGDRSITCWVSG